MEIRGHTDIRDETNSLTENKNKGKGRINNVRSRVVSLKLK